MGNSFIGSLAPTMSLPTPLIIKLKFGMQMQRLNGNLVKKYLSDLFGLGEQVLDHKCASVVFRIHSIYRSCNMHLILKSTVCHIYILE